MHMIHIDALKHVVGIKTTDIYMNKECHKYTFRVVMYPVLSFIGSYRTLLASPP